MSNIFLIMANYGEDDSIDWPVVYATTKEKAEALVANLKMKLAALQKEKQDLDEEGSDYYNRAMTIAREEYGKGPEKPGLYYSNILPEGHYGPILAYGSIAHEQRIKECEGASKPYWDHYYKLQKHPDVLKYKSWWKAEEAEWQNRAKNLFKNPRAIYSDIRLSIVEIEEGAL